MKGFCAIPLSHRRPQQRLTDLAVFRQKDQTVSSLKQGGNPSHFLISVNDAALDSSVSQNRLRGI
jgi:hypothetical protein